MSGESAVKGRVQLPLLLSLSFAPIGPFRPPELSIQS
jgi:hypothetical protein